MHGCWLYISFPANHDVLALLLCLCVRACCISQPNILIHRAHIHEISLHHPLFWKLGRKTTPHGTANTHKYPATFVTLLLSFKSWCDGCVSVHMDWQQHWEASTAGKLQTFSLIRGRLVGQAWCKDAERLQYCHIRVPLSVSTVCVCPCMCNVFVSACMCLCVWACDAVVYF